MVSSFSGKLHRRTSRTPTDACTAPKGKTSSSKRRQTPTSHSSNTDFSEVNLPIPFFLPKNLLNNRVQAPSTFTSSQARTRKKSWNNTQNSWGRNHGYPHGHLDSICAGDSNFVQFAILSDHSRVPCRWGYANINETRLQVQKMRDANIPLEGPSVPFIHFRLETDLGMH